jgi:hypothetical protein
MPFENVGEGIFRRGEKFFFIDETRERHFLGAMKSIKETETTKVQFRVRTTIFSQLFGVNGSVIPGDMQNNFEY